MTILAKLTKRLQQIARRSAAATPGPWLHGPLGMVEAWDDKEIYPGIGSARTCMTATDRVASTPTSSFTRTIGASRRRIQSRASFCRRWWSMLTNGESCIREHESKTMP